MRFKAKAESEAEQLRAEQLQGGKVLFSGTKSGKNRSVPLAGDLYKVLKAKKGKLFQSCYSAFRSSINKKRY